jgi:hypothetical protein
MKTLREYINLVDNGPTIITDAKVIDPQATTYANAITQIAQNRMSSATKMLASKDPDERYTAKVMMRDAKNWARVAKSFASGGMQAGAEKFFELDDYDDLWEFLEDDGHDVRKDILPLR